jgi:gas vesicle protein
MTTEPDSPSTTHAMLWALLGGAALGAAVVALTTPRTGQEVRAGLKNSVKRLRTREEAMDDLADELIEAMFI